MLHFPGRVVTELVGKIHLVERVLEQLQFAVGFPGARQLQFVEDAEFHVCPLGLEPVEEG